MAASTFARIASPLFFVTALAALAGSGSGCLISDDTADGPCGDAPPNCGTYCPGGSDAYASCISGEWSCPDLVVCDTDAGDDDADTDGGVTCEGVTSTLDCGGCNGTPIAPVCTTEGLACPVVNCPIEPVDAGAGDASSGDASPGDASPGDASPADAGAGDASSVDSGTHDAGGDTCLEGAPCSAGESCSVTSGQTDLESCTCVGGFYACQ